MKLFFALCTLAVPAVAGYRATAQANVIENQSTYLYVNAITGFDSDSGTPSSPLKTIQAAVNRANLLNQQGIGVKVIVQPGIYRETVSVGNYKTTSAPLTIEASVAGKAVISGADVLTGWVYQNNVWIHTWTPQPTCALPSGWPAVQPIVSHPEMIFVNGVPMTQVLEANQLYPGTFFIDNLWGIVHVNPPAGTNMATAVIEGAVRPKTMSVYGRSNVVLRGLAFQGAANCMNTSGASVSSSYNVLLDSVQADWNSWGGLGVYGSNYVTVQNSVASYNGGEGVTASQNQNVLFNFNESDYNNWRGAQGAFYDWAMGGTKFFQNHTVDVEKHFSYNNQGEGLWFDTDNQNITVNGSTLSGNVQAALQVERNQGPLTLENSLLCSSGVGVNVLTSTGVTIQNNTFYNNGGTNKYQAEIYLAGVQGGKLITDWITGQNYHLFTTGMVLSGNTFLNASPGQLVFGTYLGGSDWTQFASTLKSSNNTWYDPNTSSSFKIVNGHIVELAAWQSAVQTDYSSTWAAPATSPANTCNAPAPAYADFNINLDNDNYTMASGKAVVTIHVNSFGYGPVTFKAQDMPSGVSAAFSQASISSGVVTLTFYSTTTAVAQTVPITLLGMSGSRVHTATFYLNVNPL